MSTKEKKGNRGRLYILLALLLFTSIFISILMLSRNTILARAALESNLKVTWENGTEIEYVDWGTFSRGSSKHVEIHVHNHETYPVTLDINTTEWSPTDASQYFSLTSSPEHAVIRSNSTVEIGLTLSALDVENDLTDFSFTTVVTGIECVGLSSFIPVFKYNPDTIVVYPSDSEDKPYDRVAAMVSDWTASAFVSTKLDNFSEGLDTDQDFLNSLTGATEEEYSLITFGGPIVNVAVYYYESQGTAPVIHSTVPDSANNGEPWSQWYLSNGSSITESAVEFDEHNDLFLIEMFKNSQGRDVFIAYGINWKGTYAAGKYFDSIIYPNLGSYQEKWIIVKWHDANNDGFVNGPTSGDQYTVLATSSDYK